MRKLTTLLLTLILTACLNAYPLGMSEEEWLKLTPDQQLQARMKQADLDKAREERLAKERAAEEARLAQLAAEKQQRIDDLYRWGRSGDFIQCKISNATVDFYPGWKQTEDAVFTLAREEGAWVNLRHKDSNQTTSVWADFDRDGTRVTLCHHEPTGRFSSDCRDLIGSHRDFRDGVSRDIEIPSKIKGLLSCAFTGYRRGRR